MTIDHSINNDTITLTLHGKIDSNNAGEVEKNIMDILQGNEGLNIIIDADDLQYVSSAGLRIMLRLKKMSLELRIINVSNDVYEIFDMTGFTEMITIEKGYRKVSVDGCEVIGVGANGKVYRLSDDTIIKVYKNADSLDDIKRERELARKAFVLGVPTAIPYDVVKVGDSYGSVFELISAQPFAKRLQNNIGDLDEIVKAYVDLLKIIHRTEVNEKDLLPSMKEKAIGWVDDIKSLFAEDKWQKIKMLVESVPDKHNMIHGDYHVKNVMTQNGESILIDMDTLSYGDSIFEFGQIFNSYVGFGEVDHDVIEKFMGLSFDVCNQIWDKTLRLYFSGESDSSLKEKEEKIAFIGHVRLVRIAQKNVRRGSGTKETVDYYKQKIEEALDKISDLII